MSLAARGDRGGIRRGYRLAARADCGAADLYRGERERAEPAAREAPSIKELRRAMADAHPDRGGTAEQFMEAGRRYRTARQLARR